MPTLADQIAPKPQEPSGLGGWLASIGDEMAGAFARYGRRSGAQRDASLALLNQASAPGTDPIMGAGQKLLGLAGLITHPLAFFPTREEWDQRLQAAGNDSRIGRSIGGFLSDLPSLIDPQMAAGGAALATAPLLGKMVNKVDDVADAGKAAAMNTKATMIDPNQLTFRESAQHNLDEVSRLFPKSDEMFPIVVARADDGESLIIDGHNRASVARTRGDNVPAVSVGMAEYKALKDAGFDDMQIAYAVLGRNGQADAADGIASKFPGAESGFYNAENKINEILDSMGGANVQGMSQKAPTFMSGVSARLREYIDDVNKYGQPTGAEKQLSGAKIETPEDIDALLENGASRAASEAVAELGRQLGFDVRPSGASDTSFYMTFSRAIGEPGPYGTPKEDFTVRVSDHANTTRTRVEQPDLNYAPGVMSFSDLERMLRNAKAKNREAVINDLDAAEMDFSGE